MNDSRVLSDMVADAIAHAASGVAQLEAGGAGGSASVWSSEGVLVTALHAIGQAESLRVGLGDGRVLEARVVGRDVGTDLAVLRVEADDLPALRWDDGNTLRIGNFVTPLGRPRGAVRATLGMVSALSERVRTPGGGTLDRHIEVDGALPRGFSGGPLVDHHGRALGMNTAALVRGGVTVPTVTLRRLVPILLAEGGVGRGFLGIGVHPVRVPDAVATSTAQRWALMVVSIDADGPAARDGLHVGDVILAVEGEAMQHPGDLVAALADRADRAIAIRLARAGVALELPVTAGTRR